MKPVFNKEDFRIIFMGTPLFAVESLKHIHTSGFNIIAVVTAPDKPAGRGQMLQESPVKQYALKNNLTVLQPTNLKDEHFINDLKRLNAHLNVIVAFRMLPESVWNMPPLGSINLHASLLPNYRGAAPINWAIINGESETGVTTFFLKHEVDTGDILFEEKVPILPSDNVGIVHDNLMIIGANLLLKTLESIIKGDYTEKPQILANNLKIAPKIFKTDCRIDWSKNGDQIVNLVRGLSPYPAAWSEFMTHNSDAVAVKIFDARFEPEEHNLENGTIIKKDKKQLNVAVNNGIISINELQMAGKKRVSAEEFQNGLHHISGAKMI